MAYNDQPTRASMPASVIDDSKLFEGQAEAHLAPERWASGDLPQQPADNPAMPNAGNASPPWSGLRSGR